MTLVFEIHVKIGGNVLLFFFFEAVGKHPSKLCKKTKRLIKDAAPSKSRPVVHRGMKLVHNLYAHVTCLISKS